MEFLKSMMSGIGGYFKGMLAAGAAGAIGGALLGGIIAIAAGLATGGVAWAAIGATALAGAKIGGVILGTIGGLSGAVTGVVKDREANQPSAADLTNAMNRVHEHGQLVGQQQGYAIAQQQAAKDPNWRAKIVNEQAAKAVTQANRTGP